MSGGRSVWGETFPVRALFPFDGETTALGSGLAKMLMMLLKEKPEEWRRVRKLIMMVDCKGILAALKAGSREEWAKAVALCLSKLDAEVELRWTKAHDGEAHNVMCDHLETVATTGDASSKLAKARVENVKRRVRAAGLKMMLNDAKEVERNHGRSELVAKHGRWLQQEKTAAEWSSKKERHLWEIWSASANAADQESTVEAATTENEAVEGDRKCNVPLCKWSGPVSTFEDRQKGLEHLITCGGEQHPVRTYRKLFPKEKWRPKGLAPKEKCEEIAPKAASQELKRLQLEGFLWGKPRVVAGSQDMDIENLSQRVNEANNGQNQEEDARERDPRRQEPVEEEEDDLLADL